MGNVIQSLVEVEFETNEIIYLNDSLADVHFVFLDEVERRVPANKSLLAAVSPVFEKMFFGTMKETCDVKIENTDADAFKEFLKFFYFRKVRLTTEYMKSVFDLVEKYDIWNRATEACIVQIAFDMSKDVDVNIDYRMWIYQQIIYSKMEATEAIDYFFTKPFFRNSNELFSSNSFKYIENEILKSILELDFSCKEVDLFNAVPVWAKHACKLCGTDETDKHLRDQLGDCLNSIQYNKMTIDEFSNLALKNDELFTLEEFQDIIFMLASNEYKPKIFNRIPRWNEKNVLRCMRQSSSDTKQPLYNPQTILITSNQPILLGKIHAEDIDTNLRMLDISVVITEINKVDKRFPMKIVLPKPVLVEAETQYEIRVHILTDLKEAINTDHTWDRTVELEDGIKIEFHRIPSLKYDNSTSGWISRLDFNKIKDIN